MTIIDFKTKNDRNKDLMVEKLEYYLALAKKGKIETLLVVSQSGKAVQSGCVGSWITVLGALRVAEQQVLDQSEETDPEEA